MQGWKGKKKSLITEFDASCKTTARGGFVYLYKACISPSFFFFFFFFFYISLSFPKNLAAVWFSKDETDCSDVSFENIPAVIFDRGPALLGSVVLGLCVMY